MRFSIFTVGFSILVLNFAIAPSVNAAEDIIDNVSNFFGGGVESVGEMVGPVQAMDKIAKERKSVCDQYKGKVAEKKKFTFPENANPEDIIAKAEAEANKAAKGDKVEADFFGKTECVTALLNPTDEKGEKAKYDYLYAKRGIQNENSNIRQEWIYMDWTEKREAMKIKNGGMSSVSSQLTNMATDAAIGFVGDKLGDTAGEAAGKFADAAGTGTQMVRLDSSSDAYEVWYRKMLVSSNNDTNSLGQHLMNSAIGVGSQMLGDSIGGAEGKLVTQSINNAAF